jgi:hypothetical protein
VERRAVVNQQSHFEIGRILHLKSETRNLKLDRQTSATRAF